MTHLKRLGIGIAALLLILSIIAIFCFAISFITSVSPWILAIGVFLFICYAIGYELGDKE